MAKGTPEKGRDWQSEVGSVKSSPELDKKREEFYCERAKLKLGVPDLEKVLDDPQKYGFKTDEELQRLEAFSHDVPKEKEKARRGQTLSEILEAYFREHLKSDFTDEKALAQAAAREAYLSLYYITNGQKQKGKTINVDLVRRGETVEIVDGRLYVYNKGADGRIASARIDGAYLRKPKMPRLVSPAEKGIVGKTRVAEGTPKAEAFDLPLETPEEIRAREAPKASLEALHAEAGELVKRAGELEGDLAHLAELIEAANRNMRDKGVAPDVMRASIRTALDAASELKDKVFALKKKMEALRDEMKEKQAELGPLVDEESKQSLARTIKRLDEGVSSIGEMYRVVGQKEFDLSKLNDLATPDLPPDERG